MSRQQVDRILDRQPQVATYPMRICSEEFGDESLIDAANPPHRHAKARWEKVFNELEDSDPALAIRLEEAVMMWLQESEKAAYWTGIQVGKRSQ